MSYQILTLLCCCVAVAGAGTAIYWSRQAPATRRGAEGRTARTEQVLRGTNAILRENHAILARMCRTPEQHAENDRLLAQVERIEARIGASGRDRP